MQSSDALTLTVSRSAADVAAMLLPSLPVFRTEGLAAYPQAPEISDRTNRGDLTGVRTDSIIWVIERAGKYEIPGIRFQWWDPVRNELQQRIVPGLSFDVPAPASQGDNTGPAVRSGPPSDQGHWLFWVLLAGLLCVSAWVIFNRKTSATTPEDEKSTFSRVQKACSANDAVQAYAAIHAWLAYLPPVSGETRPASLGAFAQSINDEPLADELEALQKAVIEPGTAWRGTGLVKRLKDIRQQIAEQKTVQSGSRLAPLNP
ncbi:MAG: hypothetical protein HKP21_04070, partial [Xanthomonadales bacterium]|nr:BatD family protein [Gammaproteobacteria bacterium]NNK03707.1 hypothetical protein [Xanthomonadales bacterium]